MVQCFTILVVATVGCSNLNVVKRFTLLWLHLLYHETLVEPSSKFLTVYGSCCRKSSHYVP